MQEAQEVKWKSCPFCGDEYIYALSLRKKIPWRIECSGCKARTGFYETINDAVNAWNKRTKEGLNDKSNNEHTDGAVT